MESGGALASFRDDSGSEDPVFSPDGRRLLVHDLGIGSSDGEWLMLVDAIAGELIVSIGGGGNPRLWAFSPDSRWLVAGLDDGSVQVRNAETGDLVQTLKRHGGSITAISVRQPADGILQILSGSADRTARVWNGTTGEELAILQGHTAPLAAVDFEPIDPEAEPDPEYPDLLGQVLTADKQGAIRLWDLREPSLPEEVNLFETPAGELVTAAFNATGSGLIATTKDNALAVWSLAWRGRNGFPFLAFTPDGRFMARMDRRDLVVVDVGSGETVAALQPETKDGVQYAAFAPDGSKLASVSRSSEIVIWDVKSGKPLSALAGSGRPDGITASADGRLFAIASDGDGAKVYDWSGNLVTDLSGLSDHSRGVALSPDGLRLALAETSPDGMADADVILVELPSGREIVRLTGDQWDFGRVAFSPDGAALFVSAANHVVHRWDLKTLDHLLSQPVSERPGFRLAFHRSDRRPAGLRRCDSRRGDPGDPLAGQQPGQEHHWPGADRRRRALARFRQTGSSAVLRRCPGPGPLCPNPCSRLPLDR